MAADRFEDVIRHAHLSEFGDYRVPQIVEPQADSAIEAVARTLERADSLWHTEPGITSGPRASGDDTIRTRRLPLTLRSLFIGGEPAVSGLFDHLALAAGGEAQVSCRPNGPLVPRAVRHSDASVTPSHVTATAPSIPSPHLTVTVKQAVRSSLVGFVKLSTRRNITSNAVPSRIVGTAKSIWTDPDPPSEVCSTTSGPAAGCGNVTKFGVGGPHGDWPAARWQMPSALLGRPISGAR